MDKKTPEKKQRIEYIDLAKGFCIFLVVCLHLSNFSGFDFDLNRYLHTFRMPLYYFLSGCFFKTYGGLIDFLKRKVNKLLIPFFFFYFLLSCFVPRILFDFWQINWEPLTYSAFPTAFYYGKYPLGAMWFLYCLFKINLIFYLTHMIARRTKIDVLVIVLISIIAGAIGWGSLNYGYTIPLFGYTVFINLPFFGLGYLVFRHTPLMKPNKTDRLLPLWIILSFCIVYLGVNYLDETTAMYVCGISGTMGVLWLAKWIKKLPMFSYFGRYSIMILVSHMLLCKICIELLSHYGLSPHWIFAVSILPIMLSYYAIIPFMKRYMPYVTAQKDVIKVS